MRTPASERVRRRRRGPELESALLDAAWEELVEVGYAKLTMESVAARARTGVAVLYRRWANKDQLALAAIAHHRDAHPVAIPDTGTLRGDLLAVLSGMSTDRATLVVTVSAAFSGLLTDSGLTPAEVRRRLLGEEPLGRAQVIYRRAHERGEIDLDSIPSAALAMPFDLVRHGLLMNLRPLSAARISSIVDDLFLPLAGLAPRAGRGKGIAGPR